MIPSAVVATSSSSASTPMLDSVLCSRSYSSSRINWDFPIPLPLVIVTSSYGLCPLVISFRPSQGYGMLFTWRLATSLSQVSVPATIPSGLYTAESQNACVNSCTLLAMSISLASFRGSLHILSLLGLKRSLTCSNANSPALSWSKQMTTFS